MIREGDQWKQLRLALNPIFLAKNLLSEERLKLLNSVAIDTIISCQQQFENKSYLDLINLEQMLDLYSIECKSLDIEIN